MAKGVVALYDNWTDAEAAVQDLLDNGFDRNQINIVTRHNVEEVAQRGKTRESALLSPAVGGMVAGGVAGGILAGLAGIALPGIGTVLVGGPLFAAFFGANAGAVIGGLVAPFADWGLRDNDVTFYEEGIKRGGTLIAVKTEGGASDLATSIINRHNPVNLQSRVEQWRKEGWGEPKQQDREGNAVIGKEGSPADVAWQLGGEDSALRAGKLPGMKPFEAHMDEFRQHFQSHYADQGGKFEDYLTAYRYGYDLANDERYADKDWSAVEPDLRQYWETFQPGAWQRLSEAVHFAREKARER